jgi:hypothetical protein
LFDMTNRTTSLPGRLSTLPFAIAITAVGLGIAAGGCGLGILSQAPDGGTGGTGAGGSRGLTVCDPATVTGACVATCQQTQTILTANCAACHDHKGITLMDDVLNYRSLSNVPASNRLFPTWKYVVPGDPEMSLVYHRVAVKGDMPPPSTIDAPIPRPSIDDISVLREWIQSCIPNVPGPDAGPMNPTPDAGSHSDAGGTLILCPASAPTGSCSIDGQTCGYPTETCICASGTWTCTGCPSTQPAGGTICSVGDGPDAGARDLPFNCGYGPVTCSCAAHIPIDTAPTWSCGVCPATQPSSGASCGNSSFDCSYTHANCSCVDGAWSCVELACPQPYFSTVISCQGLYTCDFPAAGQICGCGSGGRSQLACSCPIALPAEGQQCLPAGTCGYGDQSCSCGVGGWHCAPVCPSSKPSDGAVCSSTLSCAYDPALCYCAGGAWHCS